MIKQTYLKCFICLLLSLLIISIIILSCVPPVSRDALTHHLAVPKLYLQHGGFFEIPNITFSYYPMNLELLYMIPMCFGNDIIPKFIHFSFALVTAIILFLYLRKRIDTLYGLIGVLLFLSTPIIVKLSITAYVDLGLVCFSTASIILVLKWADEKFKLKYLVFSAMCCGAALGTKYNGLVVLFLLMLFVPFIYLRNNYDDKASIEWKKNNSLFKQLTAMAYGAIFLIVALLIFSPWMARNYIWKKNPIYPLYNDIINPQAKNLSNAIQKKSIIARAKYHISKNQKGKWGHFEIRRIIYKESWWQILLIPIRIFFQGKDGDPKYFDGKLNPLLLILPLFVFIFKPSHSLKLQKEANLFLVFSITFILYSFVTKDMRIRYISPIIPPLVILSVLGFKRLQERISEKIVINYRQFYKFLVTFFTFLFLFSNFIYLIEQFNYVKPFGFIRGKVSRDDYITTFRPEYPVIQYVNKNLPQESKILGVFLGNRRYYSDRDMVFNDKLLMKSVISKKYSGKILNEIKRRSITHMIIWEPFFIQWVRTNYTKKELIDLQTFFNQHTKILYTHGGYTLYQLSSQKEFN